MLYQLVVFLHVVSVLGYLLAHGVSASVSYAIKKERDVNRIADRVEKLRILLNGSALYSRRDPREFRAAPEPGVTLD